MEQIFSFCPTDKPLSAVHRSWGFPNDDELSWILDQGVSENVLWPLGGATVGFHGSTFELDHEGERALTFRALDRGKTIDLIGWQPRTGALGSWRGQAFCLGDVDDIFNPATYFGGEALRIHATPLDWLRANREGISDCAPRLGARLPCGLSAHSLLKPSPCTPSGEMA
jgi:hypothetical protein